MEELELKQAISDLGIPKAKAKEPSEDKAKPVQSKKRVKKEAEAPRRQSSRLKRTLADPDETPAKRQKHDVRWHLYLEENLTLFE